MKETQNHTEKITLFPPPTIKPQEQDDPRALKKHLRAVRATNAANEALRKGDKGRAWAIYNAGASHRGEPPVRGRRHTGSGYDGRSNSHDRKRKPTSPSEVERLIVGSVVGTIAASAFLLGAGAIGDRHAEKAQPWGEAPDPGAGADARDLHIDPLKAEITLPPSDL